MKISKGEYGYIRSQKARRLGRTAALFALAFGVFAVGMILNHGDRKNIYSIVAAVGMIPGAMSMVSTIMMWMRHPVSEELHREKRERVMEFGREREAEKARRQAAIGRCALPESAPMAHIWQMAPSIPANMALVTRCSMDFIEGEWKSCTRLAQTSF